MRAIALTGWLVIVAVLLTWQAFALVYAPAWPTLSQLFRDFMRPLAGRVVLFGVWLWLGWHLFIRGWNFFLRA